MSNAIFLQFPSDEKDYDPGNWCFWVDPISFQPTEDYKTGVGIMFDGFSKVDVHSILALCYATYPNCTKENLDELSHLLCGTFYVSLRNEQEIRRRLLQALGSLNQVKYVRDIKLQMPTFLQNVTWYNTLLAAPELHRQRERENTRKRIPQTYRELQNQADILYEALQKTMQAMTVLKSENPELNLPNIP